MFLPVFLAGFCSLFLHSLIPVGREREIFLRCAQASGLLKNIEQERIMMYAVSR